MAMQQRTFQGRQGSAGTPSSTLPPFLLGSTQSPPQRGFGQSPLPQSAMKRPNPNSRHTPNSPPKSHRRDVASTAPPIEGLFDSPSTHRPIHAADYNLGASGSPGAGQSFADRSGIVQKFNHNMGDPYSNAASPNLQPVTPFAGTMAHPFVSNPPNRPSPQVSRFPDTSAESPLIANSDMGDEITDRCWITVFGFHPDTANYILQEFSHCGTIVQHSMAMNTNWMHICYQSALQAKKALSKNLKVLMSSVMVGVVPCVDEKVMHPHSNRDRTSVATPGAGVGSPLLAGQPPVSHQRQRPLGIRPMTSSYQHTASEQMPSDPNADVPRKNSGVVGKAMEYMFGW